MHTKVRSRRSVSQVRDVARFVNSEVAGYADRCRRGQPPAVVGLWGLGAAHEQVARPLEGGFVGRALYSSAQRVALEPPAWRVTYSSSGVFAA